MPRLMNAVVEVTQPHGPGLETICVSAPGGLMRNRAPIRNAAHHRLKAG